MTPKNESSNLLFGRSVSTGDPQQHRTSQIAQKYESINGIASSKSNPQLNYMHRANKSSTSLDESNYDNSHFLLRPADNRSVVALNIFGPWIKNLFQNKTLGNINYISVDKNQTN